jgi:hypothetical protein
VIGPKLGAGREAEVYAWGDDAVSVAPRLIDVVDCAGRPGLGAGASRRVGHAGAAATPAVACAGPGAGAG